MCTLKHAYPHPVGQIVVHGTSGRMATWVGCTVWWQHAHPLLASTRDCSHYSRSLAGMALYKFYATTTPLSPVNRNARAAVLCGRPCCCIRETVWHILCAPRSAHTHLYIVHHAAKILILISFSGLFSSPLSGSLSPTSPTKIKNHYRQTYRSSTRA